VESPTPPKKDEDQSLAPSQIARKWTGFGSNTFDVAPSPPQPEMKASIQSSGTVLKWSGFGTMSASTGSAAVPKVETTGPTTGLVPQSSSSSSSVTSVAVHVMTTPAPKKWNGFGTKTFQISELSDPKNFPTLPAAQVASGPSKGVKSSSGPSTSQVQKLVDPKTEILLDLVIMTSDSACRNNMMGLYCNRGNAECPGVHCSWQAKIETALIAQKLPTNPDQKRPDQGPSDQCSGQALVIGTALSSQMPTNPDQAPDPKVKRTVVRIINNLKDMYLKKQVKVQEELNRGKPSQAGQIRRP
jgi:hypothetical protein